eukprot:TRINITY_DN3609_c0_g1_i1.p1 TRINITY_DN3609_c0_g1~~TRINITY_DN3609_c0_g1_i1.p1  ORF type:complete len:157 (-),score=7.01 TRINITY_DN3609_c0_g1_i1:326-796(-)
MNNSNKSNKNISFFLQLSLRCSDLWIEFEKKMRDTEKAAIALYTFMFIYNNKMMIQIFLMTKIVNMQVVAQYKVRIFANCSVFVVWLTFSWPVKVYRNIQLNTQGGIQFYPFQIQTLIPPKIQSKFSFFNNFFQTLLQQLKQFEKLQFSIAKLCSL